MSIKIKLVATPGNLSVEMKNLLNDLDREFFEGSPLYPKEGNYWWLAYDNNKIVGFAGLTHYKENKSCFLARVAVSKSHRGKGLQLRFIRARERVAKKLDINRIITYTVSHNIHSANNLIKAGYILYMPKYSYGPKTSFYFIKKID